MMASVKPDQDVVVQITQKFKGIKFSLPKLKKLVKTICGRFQRDDRKDTRPRHACGRATKYEVSIAIVNDAQFRRLNSRFLNRKSASDCLSFDLSDDEKSESSKLFEIVVNGEIAVKQANLRGHSDEAELALYVTHGLLHNLGFGHSTPNQARKMHDIEDEILQQLGYGMVYNKSISAQEHKKTKNK